MQPDPATQIKKKKKKKKRRAAAAEDTLAIEDRPLPTPAPAVTSPPLLAAAAPAAPPSAKVPPAPAATCLEFHAEIVAWLAKRKLELPAATSGLAARHESIAAYAAALCEALGGPQPELRERERRALVRFVTQRAAAAAAPPPSERHSSSSEDDEDGLPEAAGGLPVVEGGAWPAGLEFSSEYRWGASVPEELRLRYTRPGLPPRIARPSRRARPRLIRDPSHPSYDPEAGQCGLFASRPLARGAWVLDYIGEVSAGGCEDRDSDYVSDFGERGELALDADKVGNEARFVNDYRNTGRRPNVEFRLRRDRRGELRQGVYVAAKAGVAAGEELLINYGKPFWRARVGGRSLEEFVRVRPQAQGQAVNPAL